MPFDAARYGFGPAIRWALPAKPSRASVASRHTLVREFQSMNQIVRMSQIADADAIQEPSPKLRVPFAQSGAFVCKYIIGEPNEQAVCCGAPVPDGKSWCAYHRRIVFEPARPARIR